MKPACWQIQHFTCADARASIWSSGLQETVASILTGQRHMDMGIQNRVPRTDVLIELQALLARACAGCHATEKHIKTHLGKKIIRGPRSRKAPSCTSTCSAASIPGKSGKRAAISLGSASMSTRLKLSGSASSSSLSLSPPLASPLVLLPAAAADVRSPFPLWPLGHAVQSEAAPLPDDASSVAVAPSPSLST